MVAIPLLIIKQPWYIWMPMIIMLVNPVHGGYYCIFNQLENYFREKAKMPFFIDHTLTWFYGAKKMLQKVLDLYNKVKEYYVNNKTKVHTIAIVCAVGYVAFKVIF